MNTYNGNTKEFLLRLALLFEEYQVEMNVETDSYNNPKGVELTIPNPVSFDVFYDEWKLENPDKNYPFGNHKLYSSCDYVDIGNWNDAKALREYLK